MQSMRILNMYQTIYPINFHLNEIFCDVIIISIVVNPRANIIRCLPIIISFSFKLWQMSLLSISIYSFIQLILIKLKNYMIKVKTMKQSNKIRRFFLKKNFRLAYLI